MIDLNAYMDELRAVILSLAGAIVLFYLDCPYAGLLLGVGIAGIGYIILASHVGANPPPPPPKPTGRARARKPRAGTPSSAPRHIDYDPTIEEKF